MSDNFLLRSFACEAKIRINYRSSMIAIFSLSNIQNPALYSGKASLSTSCILSPYSEITKRLLIDSSVNCQVQ
ncbi:hypothetical protein X975_15565, partial [Stegodyphus mimosarum]